MTLTEIQGAFGRFRRASTKVLAYFEERRRDVAKKEGTRATPEYRQWSEDIQGLRDILGLLDVIEDEELAAAEQRRRQAPRGPDVLKLK